MDDIANKAADSGCRSFIQDIRDLNILYSFLGIEQFLKTNLKIFCPVDKAYSELKKRHPKLSRDKIIFDHVAIRNVSETGEETFVSMSPTSTFQFTFDKDIDTVRVQVYQISKDLVFMKH